MMAWINNDEVFDNWFDDEWKKKKNNIDDKFRVY